MRIGIMEAGRIPPDMEARHGGMTDLFRALLSAADASLEFRGFAAYEGELPASTTECDAYLVTGSRHGVYDRLPWMAALGGFARSAREDGCKLVGICFGHQLLADAFGGQVVQAANGWGIGLHRYDVHETRPWMSPAAKSFCNLVHHQDQVEVPPPGAELLAGNEFCPYGLMQLGDNVLMLQSHPEMTPAFAAELIERGAENRDEAVTRTALESLDGAGDSLLVASWIANFLR